MDNKPLRLVTSTNQHLLVVPKHFYLLLMMVIK